MFITICGRKRERWEGEKKKDCIQINCCSCSSNSKSFHLPLLQILINLSLIKPKSFLIPTTLTIHSSIKPSILMDYYKFFGNIGFGARLELYYDMIPLYWKTSVIALHGSRWEYTISSIYTLFVALLLTADIILVIF